MFINTLKSSVQPNCSVNSSIVSNSSPEIVQVFSILHGYGLMMTNRKYIVLCDVGLVARGDKKGGFSLNQYILGDYVSAN